MQNKIICRFNSKDDLDEFCIRNSLDLSCDVKEFNTINNTIKYKRSIKKRDVISEEWLEEWFDMPEYISNKQDVYAKIDFIFNDCDIELAKNMFKQNITERTKSIWYPKLIPGGYTTLRVVGGESDNKYPIYIVSKGRSTKCTTSRFLSQMETKHYVVVEPQDYDDYIKNVENDYAKVIVMDMKYKENYDCFSDLGKTSSTGPGAARNFCWDDSISKGFEWHWVMDDNANEGFFYMNNNKKQKCRTGAIFKACENFVDRYENIAIAGMNYAKFCKMSDKTPAFVMNTRIYSFLLIKNDIPYRWRGRYNEDTDLSLRVLKDGYCTVQFNAFLAGKCTTQVIQGGNTSEFYSEEGTLHKSQMLKDMHPDVSKVVWKFNRWHHQVDYSGFKQKLILKNGINKNVGINNFGMIVIDTNEENTYDTKSYLEQKYLS